MCFLFFKANLKFLVGSFFEVWVGKILLIFVLLDRGGL